MKIYKKILVFCCVALFINISVAAAAGITQYEKFITADYWMSHNLNGNEEILNVAGVEAFNKKIIATSGTVYEMVNYPQKLAGSVVKGYVTNYDVLEDDLYREGKLVSENYKNLLKTQTNAEQIPEEVKVRYGVIVRRSNMRNLPTGEGLFYYPGDKEFDALQETTLDPGEGIAILNTSSNGYFYYVQAYNYRGWVSKFDVAETNRGEWKNYVAPKTFLTVVGRDYTVKAGGEAVCYQQGSKVLLMADKGNFYIIKVPTRTKDGMLKEEKVQIAFDDTLHQGYLPYTTNNIINSTFKFYDSVYGWGGLQNSVDCSSLVSNAYRTVGIFLPRNADEQENTAGIHRKMLKMQSEQRNNIIKSLLPGSTLHMDGHVLIYLGNSNNTPYAIHSLGSHNTGGKRQLVKRVVVSDLSLERANGKTFLDDLTTCVTFQ